MYKETKVQPYFDNITLKDFIKSDNPSLESRMKGLRSFTEELFSHGHNLYRRELLSATDTVVKVKDPLTGLTKEMLMFGSNNYLGLATHPTVEKAVMAAIAKYGVGMGGPPLLNGTSELHNELETKLAAFKDSEATLLFSCGFNAIGGWLNAMVREEDIFFYDEYNHASLHNALLGVRCKKIPFRHNDMTDLRRKMEFYADKVNEKWLVVEGVYSMDGDIANLQEISLLCDTYKARLVVDDAHGTGILGLKGSGAAEILPREKVFLHLGTFSKSFAFTGGFICGSKDSINFLRYLSPQYMFSASLSPMVVAGLLAALEIMQSDTSLRKNLIENTNYFVNQLALSGIEATSSSAIVPILVPQQYNLREIALKLHERGLFINAVEYPAVPIDKQRLRISMMATHTHEQIDKLVSNLAEVLREAGMIK